MRLNKKILGKMFTELGKVPEIYYPSSYWQNLNSLHLSQLIEGDIDNFKRSVGMKYFNWGIFGILAHQTGPMLNFLKNGNLSSFLKSSFKSYNKRLGKKVTQFDFFSAQIYKFFVVSLFNYVCSIDKFKILDHIEEPLEGTPFVIKYKNKKISQDLCNSVHEFYSSTEKLDLSKHLQICDIGAGYGRQAYVFLKTIPRSTYTIIDIPPALYLAQEYLSIVFPHEKIFTYRPFKKYTEIKKEFESSRVRFLMANQIESLPLKSFDLILNISSLHEMTREQIENYIRQINRLSRGFFYTKQWRRSLYKDNLFIKEDEYPIPKSWKAIFHRRHPIQKMFFEALYKMF